MKMIRFIIAALLTISAIFLASCDPDGGYEYWIDNQSDSSLYVVFRKNNIQKINRIEVRSDKKIMFAEYETINGLFDEQENFINYWCDSLGIFTDTIPKTEIDMNYLKRDSWDYDTRETGIFGKSGVNIYTLTVTNADLKK
ncbi:MAG TPA: hypothetical protein PKM69_00335 [Bacteroidales bacterium]|nr:hypothetical protein [Bacteroidales bacterium]